MIGYPILKKIFKIIYLIICIYINPYSKIQLKFESKIFDKEILISLIQNHFCIIKSFFNIYYWPYFIWYLFKIK